MLRWAYTTGSTQHKCQRLSPNPTNATELPEAANDSHHMRALPLRAGSAGRQQGRQSHPQPRELPWGWELGLDIGHN